MKHFMLFGIFAIAGTSFAPGSSSISRTIPGSMLFSFSVRALYTHVLFPFLGLREGNDKSLVFIGGYTIGPLASLFPSHAKTIPNGVFCQFCKLQLFGSDHFRNECPLIPLGC